VPTPGRPTGPGTAAPVPSFHHQAADPSPAAASSGSSAGHLYNPGAMTDTAGPSAAASSTPLPDLVLYSREGCHLCDEVREIVVQLLERRRAHAQLAPMLVERDITTNPDWERQFFTTIPVLELGERRLELATSPARIARFLDGT
jgi:Glutaredoxin-like domain (DUF836)